MLCQFQIRVFIQRLDISQRLASFPILSGLFGWVVHAEGVAVVVVNSSSCFANGAFLPSALFHGFFCMESNSSGILCSGTTGGDTILLLLWHKLIDDGDGACWQLCCHFL
jgi:hypothetical protein